MEKGKRVFTPEFKREALRLVESRGKPLAQVARDLGISDNTLASGGRSNNSSMERRRFLAAGIKRHKKKRCVG